jgi:lysophospholipase L1-like esterase
MAMSTRVRRTLATLAAGALVVIGTMSGASAATAATSAAPVTSMAALGDSITQAAMTCSGYTVTCPANSWSTGSNTTVVSHLQRLKALGAPTTGVYNDSVSGSLSSALPGQAATAAGQGAKYVTIEIGANDACTRTVAAMTPTATFRANIDAALTTLKNSAAAPQIFVASIPSLQQLYDVNKGSSTARFTWSIFGICQSMLANPSSTSVTDTNRRAAVQTRVNEYNAQLQQACAAVPTCRYDGGAVAAYKFTKADISTKDYFHPSLTGQATLARITWAATQWVS